MAVSWADKTTLTDLHTAVLGGDLVAIEMLTAMLLERCRPIVRRAWPTLDESLVNDAVEDEIMRYVKAPGRYDASRSALSTFIVVGALRRARHAARADLRRRLREGKAASRGGDPEAAESERPAQFLQAMIARVSSDLERAFLQAKVGGERRTAVLARILEVSDLPVLHQRRIVKRVSDRLFVRLRRLVRILVHREHSF